MWEQLLPGLRIKLFMTLLLGVAYPLAMTGIAQALFPHKANGSLIRVGDKVIGSEIIAQGFTKPEYFQPRPSAAGTNGYDGTSSAGSQYGPTNKKLMDRVAASVEQFRKDNPDYKGPIPADLVTTSASGLDPELSPGAALWQVPRIARARQVAPERIREVIQSRVEGRDLGVFGEPRVNVLAVNLALDQQFGKVAPPGKSQPSSPSAAK